LDRTQAISQEAKSGYIVLTISNGNGSRIWRFRKVDVLFVVGLGLIVYGAVTFHIEYCVAGGGIAGIPLTQRGDKA
jgi:hypothetical protein